MPRTLRTLVLDLTAVALGFFVASFSTTVLAAAHLVSSSSMIPSVFLLSPNSGQALTGTVTVSASASPDTDVLQFQLNGANLGQAITVGACSLSWNTSTVADGTYNLTVLGIDSLGNSSSSSPSTITVENSAPIIANVAAAGVTSASATIMWSTNQPGSSGIDYGPTPYSNSTPMDLTMTTQHAETIVGLTAGTLYHFRVSSWNAVGMLGTSADFVFTTPTSTSPTPTPTPTAPGGCTTPDPFTSLGGGTCIDGGWYSPGTSTAGTSAPTATPTPTPTVTPTPTPTPTPTVSAGGCTTSDPFVAIGGGICSNGGWVPRNVPPTPTPTPTPPVTVFTPPSSPGQASKCTTPDPFTSLGGGTCFKGGWFPPGMLPAPGNVTPVTAPSGSGGGCVTPDPFSSIHGLHGVCVGGGWYPVKNNG
jgi:hypothetical protein